MKVTIVDTKSLCAYLIALHSAMLEVLDKDTMDKIHQMAGKEYLKTNTMSIDQINEALPSHNDNFTLSHSCCSQPILALKFRERKDVDDSKQST